MSEVLGFDDNPGECINRWRRTVLFDVIGTIADPKAKEQELASGVWPMVDAIPFPSSAQNFNIVKGCMTFSVRMGDSDLFFSVWLRPGEVRIGAKVPINLINGDAVKNKIARAYDGRECQRIERMGGMQFFDWIWRNESWAGFEFMLRSISQPIEASVLSEQMADILMHIYLSVMHAVLDGTSLSMFIPDVTHAVPYWIIVGRGDLLALADHARNHRWQIDRTTAANPAMGDASALQSMIFIPDESNIDAGNFPKIITNDFGSFTVDSARRA